MNTTKVTPRDFFLHLGATIALYASVISIINLSFSIINYYLPDQLAGYFYAGNVAWPISMLIILVPLLYILEYLILSDMRKVVEKVDLWIRRWRIYLTLFLTGAVIIGDLIALINVYLSGEISSRFIYKVLAVLVIAGVVFVYYLVAKTQVQSSDTQKPQSKTHKIFAIIGIVIVIITIVLGFMVVGSPSKQRNLRFDSQRVSDLSTIQWQVVNYWQQKGSLPVNLEELRDPISGYTLPVDPKNKDPYEYSIVASGTIVDGKPAKTGSFELCANFALEMQDNKGRGDYYGKGGVYMDSSYPVSIGPDDSDSWKHGVGRTCFTRTIDPTRYPVNPGVVK